MKKSIMKKYFVIILCLSAQTLLAQMPKHIGNFALFQQYYNPALTAYDYSSLKMFYRAQYAGFDDAPRSIFISGELDPSDLRLVNSENRHVSELNYHNHRQQAGHHAMGLAIWHDSFGAFTETLFNMNYSARVSLTEALALRAGGVVSYNINRLNMTRLSFEQANDPVYGNAAMGFYNAHRTDINVGLALTHEQFYVGYALQNVMREGLYFGDDFLRETVSRKHLVQGGARKTISEELELVINGIFSYDRFQRLSFDVQAKSVFLKTFWAGAGYRQRSAYTITAGFIMRKINLSYLLEIPAGRSSALSNLTHEVALTFDLIQVQQDSWRQRREAITW